MNDIKVMYTGQERAINDYVRKHLIGKESDEPLSNEIAVKLLSEHAKKHGLTVVYTSNGESIFLIPKDVIEDSVSFHR